MSESSKGKQGRKAYEAPRISSEIIQDLSAGGCGKCPNAGVDSSDCSSDPIQGMS